MSEIVTGCPVYASSGAPAAEAIGFRDGRVVAVGDLRDVRAALPEATVRVLDGGAVLPAFLDPHQHAFLVAADPAVDVLRSATDIASVQAAVRDAQASTGWTRLHGYLPLQLRERRSPIAAELDAVGADLPVHVLSRTYHESVVNSAGLDALGITATTPDPPGGRIVRDRRGRATGVLLETASFAAEAASRGTDAAWTTRLAAHGRLLTRHGIIAIGDGAVPAGAASEFTAVLDGVGISATPLLVGADIATPAFVPGATAKVLLDGGERCHFAFTPAQQWRMMRLALAVQLGPDAPVGRAMARVSGNPVFREGRWRYGTDFTRPGSLAVALQCAADVGSGLALHAVGNGAVAELLDVTARHPSARDVPVRIEHAMTLDPALVTRLADAGHAVVTQPGFVVADPAQFLTVGIPVPDQLLPLRAMLDAGIPVAFSSDYPASDLSPWPAIQAAVTRTVGDRRFDQHEAVTVSEALVAYTSTAAAVLGRHDGGQLTPGRRADLQWVDHDPYACDPRNLAGIRTRATWRDGEQVYVED